MAETVKVPVFGSVGKGKLAGVLIGGTAITGFLIYKKQQTAKKQAAAASAAQAQAANAYGYGAASSYGYGGVYDNGYYGYGSSGGFNPTGYYGYGLTQPPGGTLAPVANTTNAQWAQAAINQLSNDGYDKQTALAALGAYETGAPVSAAQQSIVQQAIGIEGYPPVAGANGFPPSINVQGTPGGGTGGGQTGGGGSPSQVQVPLVTGIPLAAAAAYVQGVGLVPSSTTNWQGGYNTTAAAGGQSRVKSQSPSGGTMVAPGSTVTLTT